MGSRRNQLVEDHHVGFPQNAQGFHGQQVRIAWAGTHDMNGVDNVDRQWCGSVCFTDQQAAIQW